MMLALPIGTGTCVDTDTRLTKKTASALAAGGVSSVWRYVSFGAPHAGDLDPVETAAILGASLTLLVVQHVRNAGWTASVDQGGGDGQLAASNARNAGYCLAGSALSIALDMEGVGNPGASTRMHALAWCAEVRAAGYRPVVYVGYDSGLVQADLDMLGSDVRFWRDYGASGTRPTPTRGYTLQQSAQSELAGIVVDVDTVLQPGELVGLADGAKA